LYDYEIGDFDGMYYGLTITNFVDFNETTGAQEGEGPPENLVVNSWNGMLYMNVTDFIFDIARVDQPCMMKVESNTGTINFPVNMSDSEQYSWTDWNNWQTILGVFLENEYNWWYSADDYGLQTAENYWDETSDVFDGKTLTLSSLEGFDNASYRVVIVYEDSENEIYEYNHFDFPVLLTVESGTGTAKLPDFAPRYGLEILGVYNQTEYDWDLPPEEHENQTTVNLWDPSSTFDGENLTITGLALDDEIYDIVIITRFTPMEGKGIYMSLAEMMMMSGGNPEGPEPTYGAEDYSGDESSPSIGDVMGYMSMMGLFSPAISPEWWYYEDLTTALNETLTDVSIKFNALVDYAWDNMSSDPNFPADRFLEEPILELAMSADWDDVETSREVMLN
ncbi:MAG: hypothetical protein ACTSP4_17625, partial [Candidatus Hodarchaeales archaeon]